MWCGRKIWIEKCGKITPFQRWTWSTMVGQITWQITLCGTSTAIVRRIKRKICRSSRICWWYFALRTCHCMFRKDACRSSCSGENIHVSWISCFITGQCLDGFIGQTSRSTIHGLCHRWWWIIFRSYQMDYFLFEHYIPPFLFLSFSFLFFLKNRTTTTLVAHCALLSLFYVYIIASFVFFSLVHMYLSRWTNFLFFLAAYSLYVRIFHARTNNFIFIMSYFFSAKPKTSSS